jgi:hypothetical protein
MTPEAYLGVALVPTLRSESACWATPNQTAAYNASSSTAHD